jgi:hypothetical protein
LFSPPMRLKLFLVFQWWNKCSVFDLLHMERAGWHFQYKKKSDENSSICSALKKLIIYHTIIWSKPSLTVVYAYFIRLQIDIVLKLVFLLTLLRDRPFNLKGGYVFFLKKYSDSQCCWKKYSDFGGGKK